MHTNRLIHENSPYLLQHADNPVNWYPWGVEAFQKAFTEDKPIFLSIGYSTCHWCHVMAHESFEDLEVAKMLNVTFVCIKVDREERPDIDSVYMSICQMLTGSGGWPLTILMTPDKKPFYAATYIQKESRFGRSGLKDIIPQVKHVWEKDRKSLTGSIEKIMSSILQQNNQMPGKCLDPSILDAAFDALETSFDTTNGGFGRAPKFPTPHNLLFLLRYWKRTGKINALDMVIKTLEKMRCGGIYDQLGYGFHRYATDEKWLVPHFEKMLYDQALISMVYIEAFQIKKDDFFSKTALEIFSYVNKEMTSAEGGFYSAEDADSEGIEGRFYVWEAKEVKDLFSKKAADLLIDYFHIEDSGNFRDESTGEKYGTNILHIDMNKSGLYEKYTGSRSEFDILLKGFRQKLLSKRSSRIRPFKDDKILTDWNGLMIAALAKGGRALDHSDLTSSAVRAAGFVLSTLRAPEGGLFHMFRDGQASVTAHIDDYAFFVWGLLELYETTFNLSYLEFALEFNRYMLDEFWDDKHSGFFSTADHAEKLLLRQKDSYDAAIPSGNSVAIQNMIRLSRITADPELENMAVRCVDAFAGNVTRLPAVHTMFLSAFEFLTGASSEFVIAGQEGSPDVMELLKVIRQSYVPNKVVVFHPEGAAGSAIEKISGLVKDKRSIDNKATVYFCEAYTCHQPVTNKDQLFQLLK